METIIPLDKNQLPSECYVFKHSTQCPRSATAAEEVRAHQWEMPLYWVNVIEQRPISNWIESEFSVLHESPQLILIRGGKAVGVLNHNEIRRNAFPEFRKRT